MTKSTGADRSPIWKTVRARLLLLGCLVGCASGSSNTVASPGAPVEIAPEHARLAVDANQPPYKPTLPAELNVAGNVIWGQFRVCANETGDVSGVDILTSAAPQVDTRWVETIRSWKYQPHVVEGRATPFCYKLRLQVQGGAPAP